MILSALRALGMMLLVLLGAGAMNTLFRGAAMIRIPALHRRASSPELSMLPTVVQRGRLLSRQMVLARTGSSTPRLRVMIRTATLSLPPSCVSIRIMVCRSVRLRPVSGLLSTSSPGLYIKVRVTVMCRCRLFESLDSWQRVPLVTLAKATVLPIPVCRVPAMKRMLKWALARLSSIDRLVARPELTLEAQSRGMHLTRWPTLFVGCLSMRMAFLVSGRRLSLAPTTAAPLALPALITVAIEFVGTEKLLRR